MTSPKKPEGGPAIPDLDVGVPSRRPGSPADARVSAAPSPRGSANPPVRVSAAPSPRASANPGARAAAAPAPAPPKSAQDYFGSGNFDEDHFGGGGDSLALDTNDDAAPSAAPVHFGDSPLSGADPDGDDLDLYEGSAENAKAVQSAPAFDRRVWPTGKTADSAALRIDPMEVSLAADYGSAPAVVLLAPLYTFRVLMKKRALTAKVKELSGALDAASKKRDGLLVTLVQERRGKILLKEEGEALFEPIVAIERVALERREALSGTNADYDRLARELDAQIAAAEAAVVAQEAVVADRRKVVEGLQLSFDRLDAKRKRLYIELTGLVNIAEKSQGKLSPDQTANMTRLEAAIAGQKPELDAADRALSDGKARMAAAEGDLRRLESAGRDLVKKRRSLDEQFQKQIGVRSQGVTEADERRLDAFADLGRKVLAEKGRLVEVDSASLDAVARADEAVLARLTELERFVRAVDAYDADAFKRGIVFAAALAGALVLLVAFFAVR
jgi:hypothetical protein